MTYAKKRFGQHFLIDQDVCQKIAAFIFKGEPNHILEVGPGQGALTRLLLKGSAFLSAIELDRTLVQQLKNTFPTASWNLMEGDILAADFKTLKDPVPIDCIVGNLPYQITTPFLLKYRDQAPHLNGYFLVQREVAQRLEASPGTKQYGRLSIMLQQRFDVHRLFDIPPQAFYPAPKVHSSFISCVAHTRYSSFPACFDAVVREAFCHRRKMLRKALAGWNFDFDRLGIDQQARAETLSIDDFIRLAKDKESRDKPE